MLDIKKINKDNQNFTNKDNQNFSDKNVPQTRQYSDNGAINTTFNGKNAIDDQYFYDKLFDNVTYYPNIYNEDYELNEVNETGMQKCTSQCKGNCVEYGVTGNAYCFIDV